MDYEYICSFSLFYRIEPEQLAAMLSCVKARVTEYDKHEMITLRNENVKEAGIIISGSVHTVKEDVGGNRNIVAAAGEGELIGETAACGALPRGPVYYYAEEKTVVLAFDYD